MSPDIFIIENPLLRLYFFYANLLALKVLVLAPIIGLKRLKHKLSAFANPEDAIVRNSKVKVSEDVERVRRAHLNDLENITVFFIVSFAYISTNPSIFLATNLFRIFTIARFAHTFVYTLVIIPQPARALSWFTGFIVTAIMAGMSMWHFIV